MLFTREQIIDLKSKIDIRKFYKQFLELRQSGKLLWSKCPFHNDSDPSFSIDETTGIWKCWSENISGDIIDFYERLTGKSFTDSVLDIAKSQNINIEISPELKKELEIKRAMYLLNHNISNLYQKALSQNKEGQQYLISRKFSLDIIKQFRIGYIPSFNLSNLGNKFIPLLKEVGLLNSNENGDVYNYFSTHRISIPFFDEYGHIVGFSSRAVNNEYKPKYLHSRTNKIFKKDELLYAYNFAKDKIKETKSVIITEGQIDCIRCHQFGITNAIATCGLALSDKQLKLLKTYVKNYYIIVEDKKGEAMIDKYYDTISAYNYWANIKVVRLYDGDEKCDADEFLLTKGKSAFLEKIKHAKPYHEYKLIDSLKNINYKTIDEKKFHIYNNRKYIAKITHPVDRKQYIELLAEKLELPENDIRKIIAKAENTDTDIAIGQYDDRRITSQKYILASFFSYFDTSKVCKLLNDELKVANKLDLKFKKIYEKIINILLLYGSNCDIINNIHSLDIMKQEELSIIDDAYFKKDDFDYLDDENELKAFILDQLDNLK